VGQEAATYAIALAEGDAEAVAQYLHAAAVEPARAADARIDFLLRDPHRYWIDLRVHRGADPRFEIRIALTNDTWSLRGPLERALTPMPAQLAGRQLRDSDGTEIAIMGADGWSLAFEDDYDRRRYAFIARVGDFTAPISSDHVYLYVHQTRWNQDNDAELAWHREREIARLEESWDDGSSSLVEPGDGHAPGPEQR
jgi:hypothetical protein